MYMERSFVDETLQSPSESIDSTPPASPWMQYRVVEHAKKWEILVELRCVDSSIVDVSIDEEHICVRRTLLGDFWLPSGDSFDASQVTQRIPIPEGAIPGSLKAYQFKDLLTITLDKAVVPVGHRIRPLHVDDH